MNQLFKELKYDLPASIAVFLVAVPLCLGIALASGAPLFSGIIAGIVGGMVVGTASKSPLGVSGPAAGLAVIVLGAIASLGSWEAFLLATLLSGLIQLILGFLKLGTIAYYFPTSVIKGMLSGIGLLIILKQIPHALGYDFDYEGDLSFNQPDGENTFSELGNMLDFLNPGAILITLFSLFILIFWEKVLQKKSKIFGIINGPLVAVITGIIFFNLFKSGALPFTLEASQVVQIPVAADFSGFISQFQLPDFSQLGNPLIYSTALLIAVIGSIETLLCVEATDKLDPQRRVTPANHELKAQGIGNILSGLIGGLPVTQVIVRSSANITFGGRTKLSAILHGVFLLISAIAIPRLLNMIPLATLASILLLVGYKLSKPSLYKQMYKQDWEQFMPFMATIVGILLTDLLKGITIGMIFAIFYILRNNFRNPYFRLSTKDRDEHEHVIVLSEEMTFLNKGSLLQMLNHIPAQSKVVIDASRSKFIHYDILEIIEDFKVNAINKKTEVSVIGLQDSATLSYNQSFKIQKNEDAH